MSEWVLGRRLAVGGMAEIFEATRAGGPTVIVKRLLPQYARDPEIVRTLAHEGELMRRLAHPAVIEVIDVCADHDEPFLVLAKVDGLSASDVLEALDSRPSLPMILALLADLLEALAHVHRATDDDGRALDVVHRDVTPHNVMITAEGRVLLGDFGVALSSLKDGRTRTGVIKGKLRYLAPEQVTGSDVDARTDLYAAGVIAWELLTGQRYLAGRTELDLLRAAEAPPARLVSEGGGDARFDAVLRAALSRFPEGRPRDAERLRERLLAAAPEVDLRVGRRGWAEAVALARAAGVSAAEASVGAPPGPRAARPEGAAGVEHPSPLASQPTGHRARGDAGAEVAEGDVARAPAARRWPLVGLAVALGVGGAGVWFYASGPRDGAVTEAGAVAARPTLRSLDSRPLGGAAAGELGRPRGTNAGPSLSPRGPLAVESPASEVEPAGWRDGVPPEPLGGSAGSDAPREAPGERPGGSDGVSPSGSSRRRPPSGPPSSGAARSARAASAGAADRSSTAPGRGAAARDDVASGAAGSDEPAPDEAPPGEAAAALSRSELTALERELSARGVLASDHPPGLRQALRGLRAAIARADTAGARGALERARREAAQLVVDEAFVRAKLARVDARIGRARELGVDTTAIERLSALALQDLLEHRLEATNRRLNEILRRLP